MSAIWGCIDLSGADIESDIQEKMTGCTSKYKIDRTEHLKVGNVYMACGLQYITKESGSEKLPCLKDDIFFTADCIIDNREELISELGGSKDRPDGELLFDAYNKWGESFGDHVLGLFSFAVYDKKINEFHLYTDHTSSRCIYYHIEGERVYFATLSSCITDALPHIGVCDKWMCACEALDISYTFLFDSLTPFEGIYILPYGTGIVVRRDKDSLIKEDLRYYDPMSFVRVNKKWDDDKCRQEFVETHRKCVQSAIRSGGETAVLLSSGLDSTAVASVAAKFLEKEGKNLYSFTSIPEKEYRDKAECNKGYYLDDESDNVRRFISYYPNIKPEFMDCEGENIWTYIDEWCDYLEMPSKALVNHLWMHESYREAAKKGAKVILSGQFGNSTISYGNISSTFCHLAKGGHVIEAFRQLNKYIETEGIKHPKKFLKHFFSSLFPGKFSIDDILDTETLKPEIFEKYGISKEWEKLLKASGDFVKSSDQYRHEVISAQIYQLLGVMNTKNGLYHGLLIRDPTMDKRMLELCLTIPYKYFAWNGRERRLVREYLKDYVPDEIRLITRHRGRQSGDALARVEKYGFPDGRSSIEHVSDKLSAYYDVEKVKDKLGKGIDDENLDWCAKIIAAGIFLEKNDRVG